jgi:hypothetical protein
LWEVPLGRRDGTISLASEAIANIPLPTLNFDQLKQNFASKGLDVFDLVVLSGKECHCIKEKKKKKLEHLFLYNFYEVGIYIGLIFKHRQPN